MEISQGLLLALLAWGMFCGAALGVLYDVFRILRIAHRGIFFGNSAEKIRRFFGYAVIFVEDIAFALASSAVITVLIYQANSGRIRGVAIVGAAFGFFIYYNTIGRLVIAAAELIISLIKKAVYLIFSYTLRPMIMFIKFFAGRIAIFAGNVYNKIYTDRRMKNDIASAARGFSYRINNNKETETK